MKLERLVVFLNICTVHKGKRRNTKTIAQPSILKRPVSGASRVGWLVGCFWV